MIARRGPHGKGIRVVRAGADYNDGMSDLFATVNPAAPLAERLRPQAIDDVIGQRHLLAPGQAAARSPSRRASRTR